VRLCDTDGVPVDEESNLGGAPENGVPVEVLGWVKGQEMLSQVRSHKCTRRQEDKYDVSILYRVCVLYCTVQYSIAESSKTFSLSVSNLHQGVHTTFLLDDITKTIMYCTV